MARRIGILTGGGDAPGLNGLIESSCRGLLERGYEVVGIYDGFEGIFEQRTVPLHLENVVGLHWQAGTMLGASNRSGTTGREAEFLANYRALQLDGLVVAGGDGTFAGLRPFEKEIPVVGVPKSIDNDVSGTDVSFGFDTACAVVAESVDALRATASAHRRVFVVEAMGRTTGWIALGGGLASYADAILLPERPFSRDDLLAFLRRKQASHQRGLIIVAAEGAIGIGEDAHVAFTVENSPETKRYGGCAESLSRWSEHETGWEARHVVLGHLQRARQPTTTDRFLTLSMGVEVTRMVEEQAWGQAAVFRDGHLRRVPIADLMSGARRVSVDHPWVQMAQALGIFI